MKFENEILIVYDNLNDNCVEEAKKLEKEIPNVRAVHNENIDVSCEGCDDCKIDEIPHIKQ